MARQTLATYASTTEVTAHTVTLDQASTPGKTIVAFYDSAAVVTAPAGWVKTQMYLGSSETGVLILPAASHTGALTDVVFTNSAPRQLTMYVFEDDVLNDVLVSPNVGVNLSSGAGSTVVHNTGVATFTADEALALFTLRGSDTSGPIAPASLSWDSGFVEEMAEATTGNLTYSPHAQWVGGASNVSFTASGVELTWNSDIQGVNAVGALIGYDTISGPALPWGNTIADEIAYPGDSSANWDITGMGSTDALGFSDQVSYDVGETVNFKVHSTTSTVIDIYRIGGYDTGWRKVGTCTNTITSQPDPVAITDSNGGTEASAWATTASWEVPAGAWSGMFVGVVRVAADASYIPFIVRDDARTADVVVKTSETTWGAAYNHYGTPAAPLSGRNLYGQAADFNLNNRAVAVSFDRPIITRGTNLHTYWLNAEVPLWRWLDKQGFNWKLISSVDLDEGLTTVGSAKALVSSGHDEYWSQGMWDNAEAFRDAGGHLVFMSANEVFWRVRFSGDRRTMWCYKDTMDGPSGHTGGVALDPVSWTGTWRDTRRPGGAEPENLLTGTFFRMNGARDETASIVAADVGSSPFWRGTTVETGTNLSLPRVIGFEADEYVPTQSRETLVAATSINIDGSYADDNGQIYTGNGTLNWGIQLQGYPNGSVVAGFGTNQWSWALDGVHDRTDTIPSIPAQQATINLLTDMGAIAATPVGILVDPAPVSWGEYGIGPTEISELLISDGTSWFSVPTGSPTALSLGTVDGNTVGITSDGGVDDVILPASTTSTAGMFTSTQATDLEDIGITVLLIQSRVDQDVTSGASPVFDATNFTNLPAGGGSGDVVGPASSTDNAVARFNLATGKLLQDSGVLIDDSNNLTTPGKLRGSNFKADSLIDGTNTFVGDTTSSDTTTGGQNTVIGSNAQIQNPGDDRVVSIGKDAVAGQNGVTVGANSDSDGNSVSIGNAASAITNSVAIGFAAAADTSGIAIGGTTQAIDRSVSIGLDAGSTGTDSTSVGHNAARSSTQNYTTAVGRSTEVNAAYATAIGALATANFAGSVAIGIDSTAVPAATTVIDEFVLGTASHDVKVPGTLNVTGVTEFGQDLFIDRQGQVAEAALHVKADAGEYANNIFYTGDLARWYLGKIGSNELGSDSGSDFAIGRYNDSGNWIADSVVINRANGKVTLEGDLEAGWGYFLYGADFGGFKLTSVATPTADADAANKQYVDSRIWKGTQAEYDLLTPDPDVLYVII